MSTDQETAPAESNAAPVTPAPAPEQQTVTFKVLRFNPDEDTEPHWQEFQVDVYPTVCLMR